LLIASYGYASWSDGNGLFTESMSSWVHGMDERRRRLYRASNVEAGHSRDCTCAPANRTARASPFPPPALHFLDDRGSSVRARVSCSPSCSATAAIASCARGFTRQSSPSEPGPFPFHGGASARPCPLVIPCTSEICDEYIALRTRRSPTISHLSPRLRSTLRPPPLCTDPTHSSPVFLPVTRTDDWNSRRGKAEARQPQSRPLGSSCRGTQRTHRRFPAPSFLLLALCLAFPILPLFLRSHLLKHHTSRSSSHRRSAPSGSPQSVLSQTSVVVLSPRICCQPSQSTVLPLTVRSDAPRSEVPSAPTTTVSRLHPPPIDSCPRRRHVHRSGRGLSRS